MTTYGSFDIDSVPASSDLELAAIDADHEAAEMEQAMREQVELMDSYALKLGLCVAADRAGHKPPYSIAERDAIRTQLAEAMTEHDRIEEQWQQMYSISDDTQAEITGHCRQMVDAITALPPSTWAGWAVYFLEQLDKPTGSALLSRDDILRHIRNSIAVRLADGIW